MLAAAAARHTPGEPLRDDETTLRIANWASAMMQRHKSTFIMTVLSRFASIPGLAEYVVACVSSYTSGSSSSRRADVQSTNRCLWLLTLLMTFGPEEEQRRVTVQQLERMQLLRLARQPLHAASTDKSWDLSRLHTLVMCAIQAVAQLHGDRQLQLRYWREAGAQALQVGGRSCMCRASTCGPLLQRLQPLPRRHAPGVAWGE